jgi:hypothetical protein
MRRTLGFSILPPSSEPAAGTLPENQSVASQGKSGGSWSIDSLVRKYGVICLFGFVVLNGGIFWNLRHLIFQGYGDFASFYPAGEIVRNGLSARLYDPTLQWERQQQFASSVRIRRGPLPYIRPPFEALLFLPFSFLPYPIACAVWTTINAILLALIAKLLSRIRGQRLCGPTFGLNLLALLAFFPVAFDLVQGQDAILVLLIMVLALKFLLRRQGLRCGAVLALSLFKFHLIIPILAIFLLRGKGRVVLGFMFMATVLLAVSGVMVGWVGLLAYPRYLWKLNQSPGLGMVKVQSMPNIRGLLSVVLGEGVFPSLAHWLLAGIVVLGVLIASRAWRGDDRDSIISHFCFSITVTLVASYYANSYDLTLLLLPLSLLGNAFLQSRSRSWPRILFLISAAALLCTPLLWALALRTGQFRWVGILVLGLAVSIAAAEGSGRRAAQV